MYIKDKDVIGPLEIRTILQGLKGKQNNKKRRKKIKDAPPFILDDDDVFFYSLKYIQQKKKRRTPYRYFKFVILIYILISKTYFNLNQFNN